MKIISPVCDEKRSVADSFSLANVFVFVPPPITFPILHLTPTRSSARAKMSTTDDPSFLLPYHLELFGGRDATKAAFNEGGCRTQLFDFEQRPGRTYCRVHVVYDILGQRIERDFSIPQGLSLDWTGSTAYSFVTGQTKSEYQSSLSKELGLSGSADNGGIGYALEVQDSFGEDTLEETYQHYVSSYQRTKTYNFGFVNDSPESVKTWLSDTALGIFATKDAKQIVESFGTHYMTEATFGGVQRMSSKSKIIDIAVSTELSQALGFKLIAEGEDAGGEVKGDIKDASETTRKIYNSLTDYRKVIFGGLPNDKTMPWTTTLLENPTITGNSIKRMEELIIDDPELKAAVKKEIDDRMRASLVTSKLAVAYFADFGGATNDAKSGAHDSKSSILSRGGLSNSPRYRCIDSLQHLEIWLTSDISVAGPEVREGWWSVGQYAVPSSVWDPKGKRGLMIRADGTDLVLAPTGVIRKFGMSSPIHCGLFAMACPGPAADGSPYQAISDHFAREDNPDKISFENVGCVNSRLLVEATYGEQIWCDRDSGANDRGSAWAVVYKDASGPVDVNAPQLFKAFNNYDGPYGQNVPEVWVPNFEKIALIDPLFLDGVSGVIV